MDHQDASLPLPDYDGLPFIPDPYSITISDDEARKLQEILNRDGDEYFSIEDSKYRGLELLRLGLHLLDPAGYAYYLKHPSRPTTARLPEDLLETSPVPQPAPIDLAADHEREVGQGLAMLADELRHVTRRPSHWRWCLGAMYRALGHALALGRPADFRQGNGLNDLTRLFDAVAREMPELPQVRASVEKVERLRTTYITWGVTRWPVELKKLPGIFGDCMRVVQRLGEATRPMSEAIERLLG